MCVTLRPVCVCLWAININFLYTNSNYTGIYFKIPENYYIKRDFTSIIHIIITAIKLFIVYII